MLNSATLLGGHVTNRVVLTSTCGWNDLQLMPSQSLLHIVIALQQQIQSLQQNHSTDTSHAWHRLMRTQANAPCLPENLISQHWACPHI